MKKSGLRRPVFSIAFRLFGAKCVCGETFFPLGINKLLGQSFIRFTKKETPKTMETLFNFQEVIY